MVCHFKTIFQDGTLLVQSTLSWETTTVTAGSLLPKCHYQMACLLNLSIPPEYRFTYTKAICPGTPEPWLWRVPFAVSLTNYHFKIIFQVDSIDLKRALCSRIPLIINIHSLFLNVTDEWTFKDLLLSRTLLIQWPHCPERPEIWPCTFFPCVNNEQPCQEHLLSISLLTWIALSRKTSPVTLQTLSPYCCHCVAYHFKTSPEYNSADWKSYVSWESEWPFCEWQTWLIV